MDERKKMMKKTIVVLAVLLLLSTAVMAANGPVEGKKFEFSTGLAFSIQRYHYDDGWKENYTIFQIPLRVGYFIWKGLEFEPELILTAERYKEYDPDGILAYSDHQTGYLLSGNLVYNFTLNSPRMIPFILAGYGFGNGDLEGTDVDQYESGAKNSLLNLGAGIKYTFGNIAALRFEYRFRGGTVKYTSTGDGTYTYTDKINYHTVLLGISLFF
jgi:opacity protein-like surface antigen